MQYKAIINGKIHSLGDHLNMWQAYMFATCKFGADTVIRITEDKIKAREKQIIINLPEILKTQA
ncbi:MAG: hypothetical protein H6937_02220 [Burkholderiales bacterium]|nr:hypothetical protein [Burkholderiales bacterium]